MSHSLIEIPTSDWPKLLEMYNGRKKCSSAYSLILNYINWLKKEPEIETFAKIYALDGDWQNDGTFMLIDLEMSVPKVYFNTLSGNWERLSFAFSCLDTSRPHLFFAIQERYIPIIKEYFLKVGFNQEDILIDGTVWYHIEREKALVLSTDPPSGISLGSLELQHVQIVNSIWPHRSDESDKFVERLIRSNDSVGAFDEDGNLVAWCLRLPVGSLGLVQVADTHKRQGLGSLVVRKMARIIALKNEEVLAPVVFKNAPSRSMFEKLGFRIIDNVYWVHVPGK